jgi:lipopolysaccharide/colanic/teichoic acid biosynthesis glycosyltransferase
MLESIAATSRPEALRRGHETPAKRVLCVWDATDFRRLLDHERARSDRSGQSFAVIAFTLRDQDGAYELRRTAELLAVRLRAIDELGWFDENRLGVLLPYSTPDSAWKLADDFTAEYPLSGTPPACEVFAYPTNWPAAQEESDDDSDNGGDEPPPRSVRQLEPLFARPLQWWKRLMDLAGAIAGLCLLSPLLLLAAIAIKLTSRGPVIFTQLRSGLGGRPFRMFKFRTMVVDAERLRSAYLLKNEQDGPAFKITNDPRVTWLGRWLRITSIDEFPQLLNVLKGEMSLVGPRPLPCHEAEACEVWQRRRLDVTPGLTCLWQTQGRPRTSFAFWMRLDLQYIRMQSFWTDLKLILLTIPTVLKNRADR